MMKVSQTTWHQLAELQKQPEVQTRVQDLLRELQQSQGIGTAPTRTRIAKELSALLQIPPSEVLALAHAAATDEVWALHGDDAMQALIEHSRSMGASGIPEGQTVQHYTGYQSEKSAFRKANRTIGRNLEAMHRLTSDLPRLQERLPLFERRIEQARTALEQAIADGVDDKEQRKVEGKLKTSVMNLAAAKKGLEARKDTLAMLESGKRVGQCVRHLKRHVVPQLQAEHGLEITEGTAREAVRDAAEFFVNIGIRVGKSLYVTAKNVRTKVRNGEFAKEVGQMALKELESEAQKALRKRLGAAGELIDPAVPVDPNANANANAATATDENAPVDPPVPVAVKKLVVKIAKSVFRQLWTKWLGSLRRSTIGQAVSYTLGELKRNLLGENDEPLYSSLTVEGQQAREKEWLGQGEIQGIELLANELPTTTGGRGASLTTEFGLSFGAPMAGEVCWRLGVRFSGPATGRFPVGFFSRLYLAVPGGAMTAASSLVTGTEDSCFVKAGSFDPLPVIDIGLIDGDEVAGGKGVFGGVLGIGWVTISERGFGASWRPPVVGFAPSFAMSVEHPVVARHTSKINGKVRGFVARILEKPERVKMYQDIVARCQDLFGRAKKIIHLLSQGNRASGDAPA